MLGNSAVIVVVRTRLRAIPLAKITMRKSTHGFPLSFPCMVSMGLRLAALWAAGAPLLKAFSTEIKSAQNRFVSSANCDNLSSFPNKLIPLTVGSLRILIDNISAERMNKYGDKGHPCLTPFDG